MKIPLKDIFVYVSEAMLTRLSEKHPSLKCPPDRFFRMERWPSVYYIPIDQGPYYKALTEDISIQNTYGEIGSPRYRHRTGVELTLLADSLAQDSEGVRLQAAREIFEATGRTVLVDGHRRSSILFSVFGEDHEVDVDYKQQDAPGPDIRVTCSYKC